MTVVEHQRLTVDDFLQTADFEWLMAQEFVIFTIKRHRGQWQLKVGHYIGIVLLPSGIILEILPKVIGSTNSVGQMPSPKSGAPDTTDTTDTTLATRDWVQRMLSDLTHLANDKRPDSKHFGHISAHVESLSESTLPLSQWLVQHFLQRLMGYQPHQQYQQQVHNQSALQGRLLIKEQLHHNQHKQLHKFVCEISVLSTDIVSNRFIKSALILLAPLISHPMKATLSALWQSITPLTAYDRQHLELLYPQAKRQLACQPLRQQALQSAQQLLDLAYWLLQQSTLDAGNSLNMQTMSPPSSPPRLCLLIDMNQAFEQWATERIATWFSDRPTHYRPTYQSQSVWLRDIDGQPCLSIRPDLLIHRLAHEAHRYPMDAENIEHDSTPLDVSQVSHVIDIKWKPLAHAGALAASDAYQLMSYAQAYAAEQVWLVYPVIGTKSKPIAIKPHSLTSLLDRDANQPISSEVTLWLIPFNVLTGAINGATDLIIDKDEQSA